MRKLVVPHVVFMMLFAFSPIPANALTPTEVRNQTACANATADPNANVEAHVERCKAVDTEARCHLGGGNGFPGVACGTYARPFDWNAGGALDASNAAAKFNSAFIPSLNNLNSRSAQCCVAGGSCESVGTAPPTTETTGPRDTELRNAANLRFSGVNDAHRAGVCNAIQKICQDRVVAAKTAAGANASAMNWSQAEGICNGMDGSSFASNSNTSYDSAKRSDEAAELMAGDPTQKKDPSEKDGKDPATKDSKKMKAQSAGGNPMGQLAQMAGPLLQALTQQQQQQQDPTQQQQPQIAAVQCGPGIVSAECPAQAAAADQAWNKDQGTSNFQAQSSKAAGFNPADGATPGTGNRDLAPVNGSQNQPLGAAVVANGGGAFGGGSSGSSGGVGAGGAIPTGSATLGRAGDIMHGETAHSPLSSQNAAMNTTAGGSAGGWTYGKGAGADQPVNWADWLPNGKKATRSLAGGNMRPMTEIQSKEVNIWNRISTHIKSRCSLGLLRDCYP